MEKITQLERLKGIHWGYIGVKVELTDNKSALELITDILEQLVEDAEKQKNHRHSIT
jgi:hypothetical protein